MTRAYEEPVTTLVSGPGGRDQTKTTHPAFAQIAASRVSGQSALYGSDFIHHHYITITLKGSELNRNLNSDWHFSRNELFEVALSEAQWATFVSSLNMGSGVPCTLQRDQVNGPIPQLPPPKNRADQFGAEMKESMGEAIDSLKDALAEAEALGLSKAKLDRIKAKIESARRLIEGTVPWVAKSFNEHMEEEQERAKVEIHGYAQNLFQRAGLDALTGASAPIALPDADTKLIEG